MKVFLFLVFNIVTFTASNASNEFGTSRATELCTCSDESKSDESFTPLNFDDVLNAKLLSQRRTETSFSHEHNFILQRTRGIFHTN